MRQIIFPKSNSLRPASKYRASLLGLMFFFCLVFSIKVKAQSCDSVKSCVGNAVTIFATAGKAAQWIEIDTSYRIRNIDQALTYEAWFKPQSQPGKRVYLGGIWGPNRDFNDVWVAYIVDSKIYFELSPDNSFLGSADNTIVSATVPDLYTRGWVHLAFTFDGATQQASIYVDGYLMAQGTNATYPISVLHHQDSPKLPLLFASCNGLYDDSVNNRTFKGQIDDIRLWNKALTEQQIRCQKNQSLEGNEAGLEMYLRCNDSNSVVISEGTCDATGHNHRGFLRSGAYLAPSDRTVPATFILTPSSLTATLICKDDSDFTFTLNDTSFCGNSVSAFVYYGFSSLFTLSKSSFQLQQNQPQTFTLHFNGSLTGQLWTYLYIVNNNRCGDYLQVPIIVNRSTELSYSKTSLLMDTLYVGCQEYTSTEDTITICNQSNRDLKISNAQLKNIKFSWRPHGGFPNLPVTLKPGECWKIVVKMDVDDTTRTLYDTLRITSDDRCPGSGLIPIEGRSQEVFVLLYPNAKAQIYKMDFEAVCPGMTSNTQDYQYRNLIGENIFIDSVIMTNPAFYTTRYTLPLLLRPKTAYLPQFIRFRPPSPGPFTGQMRFVCHFRGCTIVKTIDLTGSGISVDVKFDSPQVAFGNVTIGKIVQQTTTVTSVGKDPRLMSLYLKVGDVYSIVSPATFTINPNQTVTVTLSFRPRQPITYHDTLVIFDRQCYGTLAIPISGTGVFDQLEFIPPYLNISNVTGCLCRDDSIIVKNHTGSAITVTNDALNDPSGKFTLLNHIPSGSFASGQSFTYKVRFCPNDLVKDRADRAFIAINLAGGQTYELLVQGTSFTPKLSVTELTVFGPVEVGWQRDDSIGIENISPIPVRVSSVAVPAGYQLLSTSPALPVWLNPRDSIKAFIRFKPTAQASYNGLVSVTLDTPCGKQTTGEVRGSGRIIKLDVPISYINFGLHKPCECVEREIPLPNWSNFIPMNIDSIWVDAAGLPSGNASVYSWYSKASGDSTIPYNIAPYTFDTIIVRFCPNVPAIPQNLILNATLHIKASTPVWTQRFDVGLSGRRELNFTPNQSAAAFPTTRVDTSAAPIRVRVRVPDAFTNPSGDSIVFINAFFVPDQRVFTVSECSNTPLPWTVYRGDTLCLNINFKPRAPKKYEARLYLETTTPCHGYDTTILVTGEGFAPAFGLEAAFDTAKRNSDTLHITTCDTLVVPIMITRDIPQNIIDLLFRIGYDTNAVSLLDVVSPYTSVATVSDTGDGARALLKNARNVKAGTIAYVRFIPKGDTARFVLDLDDFDFDSDSLVSFKIVVAGDHGYVMIDDPQIDIQPLIDFDTVKIRDCKDLPVVVRNPGLVPMRFDSLGSLPRYHTIISADKPYPLTMQPGDSIVFMVRFCPRMEGWIDTDAYAYSDSPCFIFDTTRFHSYGWAPPFPFTMVLDPNIGTIDTVRGAITDTVEVPIIMDRDMPMTPIDMRYSVFYNRRALQYLSISSNYGKPDVKGADGALSIEMLQCDSIKAGELARLRFIMTVPDTVVSPFYLIPGQLTSDSIFFIKPIPTGDTASIKTGPKCNINYLEFTGGVIEMMALRPNPSSGRAETDFEFFGDIAPRIAIYSIEGKEAMTVLDGKTIMKGGRYHLDLDLRSLADGVYVLVYEAGRYRNSQKLVIRRQ